MRLRRRGRSLGGRRIRPGLGHLGDGLGGFGDRLGHLGDELGGFRDRLGHLDDGLGGFSDRLGHLGDGLRHIRDCLGGFRRGRQLHDLEGAVVERVVFRGTRPGRQFRVGVRAAAELGVHDLSVDGQLVAAHPEPGAQRTGQRKVEATERTRRGRGLRHFRVGSVVPVVPALCRIQAALQAHHLLAPQPDLERHVVHDRVAGRDVAGHQPRIIGARREQVAGRQVTRTHPLIPRQPLRRHERLRAGQQCRLVHRHPVGVGQRGQHHLPHPPVVAGDRRREAVGHRRVVVGGDTEMLSDPILTEVGQCPSGGLDGIGQQGTHGAEFGDRLHMHDSILPHHTASAPDRAVMLTE
ncbi:hypothetical protein RHCRD62_60381 [Rhodococcus sp. RD6.2]|nr:hypothetical protein RHCRD62_60381 [Rhodococcus sp. RD6.2]